MHARPGAVPAACFDTASARFTFQLSDSSGMISAYGLPHSCMMISAVMHHRENRISSPSNMDNYVKTYPAVSATYVALRLRLCYYRNERIDAT